MAARLLNVAIGVAVLVAAACQVGPIALVECRTTADCPAGETCSPSHACEGDGMGGTGGTGGTSGTSGTSGTGGTGIPDGGPSVPVTPEETPLAWGPDSRVRMDNPFGIRGGWYVADDCSGVAEAVAEGSFVCPPTPPTPECCTLWDASVTGPLPEKAPGVSITPGTVGDGGSRVCLKGTVTQIVNDVTNALAFGIQWGALIAIPLNDGIGYDTTAAFPGGKIIGFSFDLDGPPSTKPLRVGLHTMTNDLYFVDLEIPAQGARLLFADAKLGEWVMPQVPFDATQVADLAFDVPADESGVTPVDFCVSNLRVLQDGSAPSGD